MQVARPYVALVFLEWVMEIKWEQQGTLSQLSGRRCFLLFIFFFINFCTGTEEDWMPWENEWYLSKTLLCGSLSPFLSSDCRRSEHAGSALQRLLPATAFVASSAAARAGSVWPQQADVAKEIHWQVEQLKLGISEFGPSHPRFGNDWYVQEKLSRINLIFTLHSHLFYNPRSVHHQMSLL